MHRFLVVGLLALLLAAPAAAGDARDYYRWTDGSGSLHFAQKIEDVPAAYREAAKRVEPRKFSTRTAATPRSNAASSAGAEPKRRPYSNVAPHVVIYTAPWCGWCRKALAHLDAKGVAYVQKDIEANPANRDELIRKAGRTSIPVIEIDGQMLRGFDPGRIDALLAKR